MQSRTIEGWCEMSDHQSHCRAPLGFTCCCVEVGATKEVEPKRKAMFCPKCGSQHFDEGEWATKPHHKHLCASCGHIFRIEPYTFGIGSKKPTTAACIEDLDWWIETLNRPTYKPPGMQRQIDVMTAIRAKLIAAHEMAEAISEYRKVKNDFDGFDGDKRGIAEHYQKREDVLLSCDAAWRDAGGE